LKAFTNLQEILASKDKSLKEREEAFEKKVRLFEREHPQAGNGRDVIHLNVGGSTHVAVLRRTLTHFEHSMLASKFSGRWDDSLEKDKDGNFFIDAIPEEFVKLINHLRNLDKRKRLDLDIPIPDATFDFCWMLEYYELMLSVYPHKWNLVWGNDTIVTQPPTPNDSFIIETGHLMGAFVLDLDEACSGKPRNAASLTVVFERGTVGQIGWSQPIGDSEKVGLHIHRYSLALDIEEKRWLEKSVATENNVCVSTRDTEIEVLCTFSKRTNKYAVRVVGSEPEISREISGYGSAYIKPHISLIGKVRIFNLSYSF